MTMAWALEDILPGIVNAGDAGLTLGKIKGKLSKKHHAKLPDTLKSLINAKEIRGPIKFGPSEYYFAAGRGPSAQVTCDVVCDLVLASQTKLLSLAKLKEKVTGLKGCFLIEGVKLAITSSKIIELTCGTSKYYLHRDVAQGHFGLSKATDLSKAAPADPQPPAKQSSELTLQAVRPVFQRLRAQQGGLGTIDIYDLLNALGVSKDTLHQFLVKEAKAGHLTIHPTTTVQLEPEVIDAAIRLPGFSEPFVTVALKDE
jgi:hypothetical protein